MIIRAKINIRGAVQGVGFRPFVYRLADDLGLNGFVYNSAQGVFIEVEGIKQVLDEFILRLKNEKPNLSVITGMEFSFLDLKGFEDFRILESENGNEKTAIILPDIAVCKDCIGEMNDTANRRYRYPFINCTNCGPRFSIIKTLPYDRPNTSMRIFTMCNECKNEYNNPLNRRFHAQPIACPNCGPNVEFLGKERVDSLYGELAIESTVNKILEGKIIALKGLGGYQLIVDARNNNSVINLRKRKNRDEKPFALMFPSINSIMELCNLSEFEIRLLQSPESPIVLLKKRKDIKPNISNNIAPDNPYLGVMLPYTPIHHLLLKDLNFPIVATSGNISEEPMCINEEEAFSKLSSIADYYLVHNRPIVRQVDDSIVKIMRNRELILRRARGYSPLPITLVNDKYNDKSVLAVGGHLKNNIALKIGENVFVSQYIGELSNEPAYSAFINIINDLKKIYDTEPSELICDMHPEYLSTNYAKSFSINHKSVQHHFAHIASCRAENQIEGKTTGVSWDGTGYGLDGTIWGGEFFISDENTYSHIAQFRQFQLPGGEKAIKESRRSALGVLYELYGSDAFNDISLFEDMKFSNNEIKILGSMLKNNINSPKTSSVGRLFDAVSSLLNISNCSNYEGQSAMKLEFILDKNESGKYPFELKENKKFIIDWQKMIESILEDKLSGIDKSIISAKFHNTLVEIIVLISNIMGEEKVVLSGGCFQNLYLAEKTIELLEYKKHKVYMHQRIPPNDGGIALGQIAAADVEYSEFDVSDHKSYYKFNKI